MQNPPTWSADKKKHTMVVRGQQDGRFLARKSCNSQTLTCQTIHNDYATIKTITENQRQM